MKITPIEITNKEFKKTMRGYSVDEVDEFLDEIVEEYEGIFRENIYLKEKIEINNERLEHYKNLEETIQNTLVLAQTTADKTKEQADNEASYIIDNASEKAARIIEDANFEKEEIFKEYERYKMEFSNLRIRVDNFLKNQLNFFSEMSQEIEEDSFGKMPSSKSEDIEEEILLVDDAVEKEDKEDFIFEPEAGIGNDYLIQSEDRYVFGDEDDPFVDDISENQDLSEDNIDFGDGKVKG